MKLQLSEAWTLQLMINVAMLIIRSTPPSQHNEAGLNVLPSMAHYDFNKIEIYYECHVTVCRMTQSKVKVMDV